MDDGAESRLRVLERRVEERLRELAEMGQLSDLPGEGRPLPDDDPRAGDRWAARHVAKNANVRPEFVELRREIADRRDRLIAGRAHRDWIANRAALLDDLRPRGSRCIVGHDRLYARVESELRSALGELTRWSPATT